jgi:hypothetical protein
VALLIIGQKPAWFLPYPPIPAGAAFLALLWRSAFRAAPASAIEWLVSEYELPVPPEWRADIGLTYGCPDFACRAGDHVLIIELKTERGSYRVRQMPDYIRLARRKHPDDWVDLVLLGPTRPGASPSCDERQR